MSRKSKPPPFLVRWRNDMLNDPRVKWQGRLAGMALTIWANVLDGSNCYPSAQQCADKMAVSKGTIERGWAQLKAAGWITVKQLPPKQTRSNGSRTAWKFLTWPQAGSYEPTGKPAVMTCPIHTGEKLWLGQQEDTVYCLLYTSRCV